MKPPAKSVKKSLPAEKIFSESESVTVRVKRDHLEKIDAIAETMGLNRSAAIKVAIAEMIERRGKL